MGRASAYVCRDVAAVTNRIMLVAPGAVGARKTGDPHRSQRRRPRPGRVSAGWLRIGISEGRAGKVSSVLGGAGSRGDKAKWKYWCIQAFPSPGSGCSSSWSQGTSVGGNIPYLRVWRCERCRCQSTLGQTQLSWSLWGRFRLFLAFGGLFFCGPGSFLVPEDLVWAGWRSHG